MPKNIKMILLIFINKKPFEEDEAIEMVELSGRHWMNEPKNIKIHLSFFNVHLIK